jgi:hypothetical protein
MSPSTTSPARQRREINHLTIKLVVGVVALTLPSIVSYVARLQGGEALDSISDAYHRGGWARDILVGLLFVIASLLLAYNGYGKVDAVASRIAALAAMGVALMPCKCRVHDEVIPGAHAWASAILFAVLIYFCWRFIQRARSKHITQARRRSVVYQLCGAVMGVALIVLAYNRVTSGSLESQFPSLVYWGETAALMAFGVAWLTASRAVPWLTRRDELYWQRGGQEPADLADPLSPLE